MKLILKFLPLLFLSLWCTESFSATENNGPFKYPFYFGFSAGYGSTTWQGLVPSKENQNDAMSLSTPTSVHEGGLAGGVMGGYEFTPYFALEGSYTRYPDAKVIFDQMSLVTFNYKIQNINTRTEIFAAMAKIMLIIPCTTIRAYSSFGVGDLHRYDRIKESWHLSPTFGLGLNYNVTQRIMAELGGNYTSGYGESELNPSEDFMPFLYGIFFRLAYRF